MRNNQNLLNRQINSGKVNGRQLPSTSPVHDYYRGTTPIRSNSRKYNTTDL